MYNDSDKVVTGGGECKKRKKELKKEVEQLKQQVEQLQQQLAASPNASGATTGATAAAPANDRFGIPMETYRQGFLNVVARSNIAYPASAEERKAAIANTITEVMGMPNIATYKNLNVNFSPNPSNGKLNYKNGFLNVISRYNAASDTSNFMKRMTVGNNSSPEEIQKVRETRIKTALNEVQNRNNAGPQGLGSYTMEAFKDAAANYSNYAMNGFKNTTQGGRRRRKSGRSRTGRKSGRKSGKRSGRRTRRNKK